MKRKHLNSFTRSPMSYFDRRATDAIELFVFLAVKTHGPCCVTCVGSAGTVSKMTAQSISGTRSIKPTFRHIQHR